ncbi:unnamed protein product, partial [Citrullus colocynthis]
MKLNEFYPGVLNRGSFKPRYSEPFNFRSSRGEGSQSYSGSRRPFESIKGSQFRSSNGVSAGVDSKHVCAKCGRKHWGPCFGK